MQLDEIREYLDLNFKLVQDKWTGIVIHHSLTLDDKVLSNWQAIRNYHTNKRGWRDIGYHFGVEYINNQLEYQIGRQLDWNGAHCVGLNQTHLGICLVGNYDEKSPSEEQYIALKNLILLLKQYFKITEVIGHREAIERLKNEPMKSCPGKKFDMDYLRKILSLPEPPAKTA